MKKTLRKAVLIILSSLLTLNFQCDLFLHAQMIAEGDCGAAVHWQIEDHTLAFTGSGAMNNYEAETAPWFDNADYIYNITIAQGITTIGDYAFYGLENLTQNIAVPASITTLGNNCFASIATGIKVSVGCSQFNSTMLTQSGLPEAQVLKNHSWNEGMVVLKPTTVNPGMRTFNCKNCSATKNEEIPMLIAAGVAGTNATWTMDEHGAVTVSGTGIVSPDSQLYNQKEFVESIVIENGLTMIDDCAFEDYMNLGSITLPVSVFSVGNEAFKGCLSLSSFDFSNIIEIGDSSFENCASLQQASFSSSLQMIPNRAFAGCASLTSVTFNEGLIAIGSYAFANTGLASIALPASLSSIGDFVFAGSYNLANLTISDYNPTFYSSGCNALITYDGDKLVLATKGTTTIPNYIAELGYGAFAGIRPYNNLAGGGIFIPTSVSKIGTDCFKDYQGTVSVACTQFTDSQIVNASISNIQYVHAWDDGVLTTLPSDEISGVITYTCIHDSTHQRQEEVGKAKAFHYNDDSTVFWYIDQYDVLHVSAGADAVLTAKIGEQWAAYNEIIKEVRVERGIKTIESYSFKSLYTCLAVYIGADVTDIQDGAFVKMPQVNTVKVSTDNAKYDCYCNGIIESATCRLIFACNYTNLSIGVWEIASHAFDGLTDMKILSIPYGIKKIADDAFIEMLSLEQITVHAYNTNYTDEGSNCIIDRSTGKLILGCCNSTIPECINTIGAYAFNYAEMLFEITIPATVTLIEPGAFSYCSNLTSITVDEDNDHYVTASGNYGVWDRNDINKPYTLIVGCAQTKLEEVDRIGDYAFKGNRMIENIVLSKELAYLGYEAFADCVVNNLVIPVSYPCWDDRFTGASIKCVVLINDKWQMSSYDYDLTNYFKTVWYNTDIDIVIENDIYDIGDYAFKGYKGKLISLPESVKNLGTGTFEDCKAEVSFGCKQFDSNIINQAGIEKPVLTHKYSSSYTTDVYPDCTQDGQKSRHCVNCEVKTDITTISKLGHNMTFTAAKAATCLEGGNIAYYYCNRCKKYFQDEEGTSVIIGDVTTNALGHNLAHFVAKDATCTEKGNIEYWYCMRCKKYYSDEACTQEITKAQTEIAAASHMVYHYEAAEATCTTDGYLEYWYCPNCDKIYLDAECTEAATGYDAIVLNTLGHNWEDHYTIDTPADCENPGTKSIHCTRCTETKDSTIIQPSGHHGNKVDKVDESCEEDGCMEYYECTGCHQLFADEACTQQVTIAQLIISAHGHQYGAYVSDNNATLDDDGTQTRECEYCHHKDTITEVGSKLALSSIEVDALPTKRYYKKLTEELDLSGGTLMLYFTNGNTSQIFIKDNSKVEVSGFDNATVGMKRIELVYYGKTASFEITVQDDIRADFNRDGKVNDRDAVYLLYHCIFQNDDDYTIYQDADLNKDGKVNDRDAVYLLYHCIFPNDPDYGID